MPDLSINALAMMRDEAVHHYHDSSPLGKMAGHVLTLVAAYRMLQLENRSLRRYSMCGKIAIGTGFAPPGAAWLEDAEWTDEQYAQAQAMIDAHPEWTEGLTDDT